jgi:head-tail adaptor
MAVRAGELDRLFTLEEPSDSVVAGEATVVWTVKGESWGSLEGTSGSEGRLSADGGYLITMRHRSDLTITSRWRLGLKGTAQKFSITAPPQDPDGRRREMLIRATEVLA